MTLGGKEVFPYEPHADSKVIDTTTSADDDLTTQNVNFDDAHPGFEDTRGEVTDPLRTGMDSNDVPLSKFFSRPIKIRTTEWSPGGAAPSLSSFNPWQDFFENVRVINRLSNYKLMRATLHVKFVVNGNSFYYGRGLATYRPLHNQDNTTVLIPGNFADLVEASQRPHIYINPTLSQGGTMVLPFFTYLNMLDITKQDWRDMGIIDIEYPVPLKHANGATTPITISIFAWAEGVELVGLTQANPGNSALAPQGKEESGIVSKPASMVAKTASLFKSVPYIGAFATATEIGARAIGTMAALFGYSKPVREDITEYQPVSRQSMANCDGRENLLKLTIDTKNELSIDPKIASLEMPDELTITSIAGRESLLTKFDWAETVDEETLLFNIIVDPCVLRQFNQQLHFPACCFATMPFEFWKGTMRYRFQVVCSAFHKGRLKIVYDPFGVPQTAGVYDPAEYNVAYTQIIDLATCNDFTVDVGWGQSTPFRRHLNAPQLLGTTFSGASGTSPATPVNLLSSNVLDAGNGTLSVYIVNELTVPNSTSNNDVEILVSVSACDDFEVAAPSSHYLQRLMITPFIGPEGLIEPQGEIEPHGEENMLGLDTPVVDPQPLNYMGSSCPLDPIVNRIHFGEVIASFRSMLKRYNLHEGISTPPEGGGAIWIFQRRMFPFWPGYTGAPTTASNLITDGNGLTGNFVYANMTLLHYLTPAFGAWRGSIRYTLDTTYKDQLTSGGDTHAVHMSTWSVSRIGDTFRKDLADTVDNNLNPAVNINNGTDNKQELYAAVKWNNHGHDGNTVWNTNVNPVQSFEVPFYSQYRFAPARQRQLWQDKDQFQPSFRMTRTGVPTLGTEVAYKYVAAGEDFTLMFYLSPPIFYAETLPDPTITPP